MTDVSPCCYLCPYIAAAQSATLIAAVFGSADPRPQGPQLVLKQYGCCTIEDAKAVTNPIKAQAIEIRSAGKDVLVHDPEREQIHVLNTSAGRVLEMCDGTRSANDIARSLSGSSGAKLSIVGRDVAAILTQFMELKLLQS